MEKKAILYLSGPITGVEGYKRKFEAAARELRIAGYNVINPAELNNVLHYGATYEDFMRIDLELLAMADALVQLPGWENSKGCKRELGYALGADKIVISLEAMLEEGGHNGG